MQIKLRGIHPTPTTPSASNSTIITTSHLASSRLDNPRRPPTTSVTSPATPTRERICFPAQPVRARPSSHTCTKQAYQDPPAAAPQHHHTRACLAWAHNLTWRGRTSASDGALACFPTGQDSERVWGKDRRRAAGSVVGDKGISLTVAGVRGKVLEPVRGCGVAKGVCQEGRVWLYYITGHGGLHFLSVLKAGIPYAGFETRLWRIDKVSVFSSLVAFSPQLLLIRPLLFSRILLSRPGRERFIRHGD